MEVQGITIFTNLIEILDTNGKLLPKFVVVRNGIESSDFVRKGNENNKTGSGKTAWHGKRCGIGFVDEVKVNADGSLGYIRRMNGDQSHQGRHVRIPTGHFSILHVVLYDYK